MLCLEMLEGVVLGCGWEVEWGTLDALSRLGTGQGCRQEGRWAQGAGVRSYGCW